MTLTQFVTLMLLEVLSLLLYFKIAQYYQIIDRPNDRSSHSIPIIRGGGVVFVLAVLLWFLLNSFPFPWFVLAILMLALVSFIDDVKGLSPIIRFAIQFLSLMLLGVELRLYNESSGLIAAFLVLGVGALNVFNFMDGINGITGVYALVNLGSFYYINQNLKSFTSENLILSLVISVLVFLFYNFRKRARCFAGDVGSVTLGFVQIFLIAQLLLSTGDFRWILIFLVYGTDSVITILYRLRKRENIFQPHRQHLYQYLSNECHLDHRFVSLLFGMIQLGVNSGVIYFLPTGVTTAIIIISSGILMFLLREVVLYRIGKEGLLIKR